MALSGNRWMLQTRFLKMNDPCDDCLICCCLGMALSGNRWMLQTRFLKMNDPCDDCLICCNAALACLACIMRCAGADDDATDMVTIVSDIMNICVVSCMLAQQQVEIEHIKTETIEPALSKILAYLPPKQQEMINL